MMQKPKSVSKVTITARGPLRGSLVVPPSKSYTHRAVLMASLAAGKSKVSRPLISRDTAATIEACGMIGATLNETDSAILVEGTKPTTPDDVVDVQNSGTTLRFMTSVLALAPDGYSVLTGDSSIRKRPMQPLLDALSVLGVRAWSARGNGCAPIIVEGGGFHGGEAVIKGDVSSQFVSSLLISAPLGDKDTKLNVMEAVSRPYIDATIHMLGLFGIHVEREGYSNFSIPSTQVYSPRDFRVPSDFSSASFAMAAVALRGGRVVMRGLDAELPQADAAIVDVLESLGVKVNRAQDSVTVEADGDFLKGGRFRLSNSPDLLPVVAALALKSKEPVEILGVGHARFKETDRIGVITNEFRKIGVHVDEMKDGMKIRPPHSFKRSLVDAHDDHRIFMALSLVSLLVPEGIPVVGSESLDVSYPEFLSDLKRIGASVKTR
jgi:3-phosphoshikimate 1-carboxyvinyltransferase